MITTKDLMALGELMTFENWIAVKLINFSKTISNEDLKKTFDQMAEDHIKQHQALLSYLKSNAQKKGE